MTRDHGFYFRNIFYVFFHSSRQKEAEYLQLGKQLTSKLDKQKVDLEKADNFPDNSNTEVSKLREQLLNYNNQLAETDEMNYQLQYKLERFGINFIHKSNFI